MNVVEQNVLVADAYFHESGDAGRQGSTEGVWRASLNRRVY